MEKASPSRSIEFVAYQVLPDSPQIQHDFLMAMASLGVLSSHDFAAEVVRVARHNMIPPMSLEGFREVPGQGVSGFLKFPGEKRPRVVALGNREFINECGLQIPELLESAARAWEREPDSFIALGGWDGLVRGILRFKRS
jgi:cation transport ATPase